mgnify:FL=1
MPEGGGQGGQEPRGQEEGHLEEGVGLEERDPGPRPQGNEPPAQAQGTPKVERCPELGPPRERRRGVWSARVARCPTMEGMDPLAVLAESRLLPLLTVRGGEDLLGLARVLEEEGVGALEITLRTEKGLEALKALRKSGLLLGAGTVRSPKEAEAALEAGAAFLVSPGLLEEVAALAQARGVPYLPGVLTPTEVERALALGLSALKFFPAEPFQGARVLKAYAEVFPEVAVSYRAFDFRS